MNEFFTKNVEQKAKPRGQNSFVAPNAYYEFQIDLFFSNDIPKPKMKVGMMCIDIFLSIWLLSRVCQNSQRTF